MRSRLSRDPNERMLEQALDATMRRRIRDSSASLDAVLACARSLQEYRVSQGYVGRLDERVGKLDGNERWIVDLLLVEGRNVTHVAPAKSGAQSPDLVVDGEFAEIKTSLGSSVESLGTRLAGSQSGRVFINARATRIPLDAVEGLVRDLIAGGTLSYARVCATECSSVFGSW